MQKDTARQKLGEVLQAESDLLDRLAGEQQELKQLHHDQEDLKQNGITAHELELYENRCRHKKDCLAVLEEKLIAVRDEVIVRRQALMEASKEEKILEKLKERQAKEEEREARRKENAQADEIAGRFHGR